MTWFLFEILCRDINNSPNSRREAPLLAIFFLCWLFRFFVCVCVDEPLCPFSTPAGCCLAMCIDSIRRWFQLLSFMNENLQQKKSFKAKRRCESCSPISRVVQKRRKKEKQFHNVPPVVRRTSSFGADGRPWPWRPHRFLLADKSSPGWNIAASTIRP